MRFIFTRITFLLISAFALSAAVPSFQQSGHPGFFYNSEVARFFQMGYRAAPAFLPSPSAPTPADTAATHFNILLFNYATYDSVYAVQMQRFLQRELPGATISEFWDGSQGRLETSIRKQNAVVISYPSNGDAAILETYGDKLEQFVRNGGLVLITGTHAQTAIDQLGLLDTEYAYYYETAGIHQKKENHPLFNGIPTDFTIANNYTYPLEINDAGFVTLAEAEGLPVIGYKELGEGKIVYIGFEYYDDEFTASQILGNVFKWALTPKSPAPVSATETPRTVLKRTEEILYAGSVPVFDLKIYPNPYFEKAALEFDLDKATMVSVEMTNENGSTALRLLPQRNLSSGHYRVEVPDVAPGIYFVKCKIGGHIEVRKIVKLAQQ